MELFGSSKTSGPIIESRMLLIKKGKSDQTVERFFNLWIKRVNRIYDYD